MKGKRYTTGQKIRILREGERSDTAVTDVCREHRISGQTFHRWRRGFGMLADGMPGKVPLWDALGKKW